MARITFLLLKQSGIIERTELAKNKYEKAQEEENVRLEDYQAEIDNYASGENNEDNGNGEENKQDVDRVYLIKDGIEQFLEPAELVHTTRSSQDGYLKLTFNTNGKARYRYSIIIDEIENYKFFIDCSAVISATSNTSKVFVNFGNKDDEVMNYQDFYTSLYEVNGSGSTTVRRSTFEVDTTEIV